MELKYLLAYAPFNIKGLVGNTQRDLTAISLDSEFIFLTSYKGSRVKQMAGIEQFKPILKPMKCLSQDIETMRELITITDGWVSEEENYHQFLYNCMNDIAIYPRNVNNAIQELFLKNHYDIFNLIPNGLAIDINTL